MGLSLLEASFTLSKIKQATFSLSADKAPGPDGFPIFFFQKFWDIISNNLCQFCFDFYKGKANLDRIDCSSIILIPKNNSPISLTDLRAISLINSVLKIISKILASINGRNVVDNIITTKELIFSLQQRRLPWHILKVDFSKAFNVLD